MTGRRRHRCVASGCPFMVEGRFSFCGNHWRLIPELLREGLDAARVRMPHALEPGERVALERKIRGLVAVAIDMLREGAPRQEVHAA